MACRSVQKHLAHPEMVGRNSSEHAEYHLLDEQICCCNNSVRICGSNTCNLFNWKAFCKPDYGPSRVSAFAKKHLKTANSADEECISEEESAPLSAEVDSFADTVDSDEPTEDAAANTWGEKETDRNDSGCDWFVRKSAFRSVFEQNGPP